MFPDDALIAQNTFSLYLLCFSMKRNQVFPIIVLDKNHSVLTSPFLISNKTKIKQESREILKTFQIEIHNQ
jgi:hypothetical protein